MGGPTQNNYYFTIVLAFLLSLIMIYDALLVYRIVAFKTVPHDDYAPYLQYLSSFGAHGDVPGSPWRERIGSVLLSVPFLIVPAVKFSGNMLIEDGMQKYYFALSVANVFYFYLGCLLIARYSLKAAGRRLGDIPVHQMFFFIGTFVLARHVMGLQAADGIGLFLVSVALPFILHRRHTALVIYSLLMLFFNEKVSIIVLAYFLAASVYDRGQIKFALLSALICVAYVVYRGIWGVGKLDQMDSDYLSKLIAFAASAKSPRGLILNIVPAAFLVLCSALIRDKYWRVVSLTAVVLLLIASVQAEVVFNVGRIAFYALPLVLYSCAAGLGRSEGVVASD